MGEHFRKMKLASAFSLPVCENLTQRAMNDFAMDPEQKEALGNLSALACDSDGDSSRDCDSHMSEGKWNI